MSWQAVQWAFEDSGVDDVYDRFTLVCLATFADAEGRNAWPSVPTIASHTGMSIRRVQIALRNLENEWGAIAANGTGRRGSTIYDLAMTPAPRAGVHDVRGAHGAGGGVHDMPGPPAPGAPEPSSTTHKHPERARDQAHERDLAELVALLHHEWTTGGEVSDTDYQRRLELERTVDRWWQSQPHDDDDADERRDAEYDRLARARRGEAPPDERRTAA